MAASILCVDQHSLWPLLLWSHAEAASGHWSHPHLRQCCLSRKAPTTASNFPLGTQVSHSSPIPCPCYWQYGQHHWCAVGFWLQLTSVTCPSSQDAERNNHHGAKSYVYSFSFLQTQKDNRPPLPKHKKETQQMHFLRISQPPVQPSSSVPPFTVTHVIFLLSGLEAIICTPGTGLPAQSHHCTQPSCRRQLFKSLNPPAHNGFISCPLPATLMQPAPSSFSGLLPLKDLHTGRQEARGPKPQQQWGRHIFCFAPCETHTQIQALKQPPLIPALLDRHIRAAKGATWKVSRVPRSTNLPEGGYKSKRPFTNHLLLAMQLQPLLKARW